MIPPIPLTYSFFIMNTNQAILNALSNLSRTNTKLYDHWMSILYYVNGDRDKEEWNEDNLKLMERDVMSMQILFSI